MLDSPGYTVAICPRCNGAYDSLLHGKHCCACRKVERNGETLQIFCWDHAPDVLAPNQRIECGCGRAWLKSTSVYACRECRAENNDAWVGGMRR